MKKVVLALIVSMLAMPAFAGVTVDCNITDTNLVTVTYAMDGGDPNLPRAFGLDIVADANISLDASPPSADINDSDYYIYPGSIDVNDDTGEVDNWGSPVASLDGNDMTVEMGSLYADDDPDHNTPPPSSGWLIKFRVASANPSVNILENTLRGGVVMEDTEVNFPGGYVTCDECAGGVTYYTISGRVTYVGSGLDDVTMSGLPSGSIVTAGGGYYSDDAVPSGWDGTVTPSKTGYGFKDPNTEYTNVDDDQPNQDYCAYPGCWDYVTQCHGDADGDVDVDTDDWPYFRDGFAKTYPDATYVAHACGDYDHDGDIDTDDWPEFRDNFAKTPDSNCTPLGDYNGIFCP